MVVNAKYNANTEAIFKNLSLQQLEDIFPLNMLKFYYKYKHGILPSYFNSFDLVSRRNIHSHNTRNNHTLCSQITKTNFARKCIRHALPHVINNMSSLVIDKLFSHSYKGFIDYAKFFMLQKYSFDCSIVNCYVCG